MANEITRPSGLFLKQTLPLAVLVSGAMALENGLPASSVFRDLAEAGGLMSYSMDVDDGFYRAAYLVDRLLKGAKPANLPIEQPTKFELVVNLKTAKALGITIPQSILLRADEVIR